MVDKLYHTANPRSSLRPIVCLVVEKNYLQVTSLVTIDTLHEPKQVFHTMITTNSLSSLHKKKNKTNLVFTVSHLFNRRDVCQGGVSIQQVIWGSDRIY